MFYQSGTRYRYIGTLYELLKKYEKDIISVYIQMIDYSGEIKVSI